MVNRSTNADILTTNGQILSDVDMSEARFYWGDEYGRIYGTSGDLARVALSSGLLEGIAFDTGNSSLAIVAAALNSDLELYGAVASQYLDTHATTPVLGSTAFNPEFLGIVYVEQDPDLQLDTPAVRASFAAYTSVIDRAAA